MVLYTFSADADLRPGEFYCRTCPSRPDAAQKGRLLRTLCRLPHGSTTPPQGVVHKGGVVSMGHAHVPGVVVSSTVSPVGHGEHPAPVPPEIMSLQQMRETGMRPTLVCGISPRI